MTAALAPLDILLHEMRRKWEAGDTEGAIALARIAAPFVHARPAPARPAFENLRTMTDAELEALCGAGDGAGEDAAAEDQEQSC